MAVGARRSRRRSDERAVGFALAPRLNAAGRLYRADAGLELILTEDPLRARADRRELDRANAERRQVERASASRPKRRWPSWASAPPTCWPARAGIRA